MSSISKQVEIDYRITPTYRRIFEELSNIERYQTYSVAEFYCDRKKKSNPDKVNVIIRIDVDSGFHLSVPLAEALLSYNINSTHYFLTHPERYYKIWESGIPRKIHEYGHEVGLHSDHYYEQVSMGINGLKKLKEDIVHLSKETGAPIRGMVFHGHNDIETFCTTNWELTKNVTSEEIGLEYHDGLKSCYIKPTSFNWQPDCDKSISDFFGFPDSWGWNYYPAYPLQFLENAKPGRILHVTFHTRNAFRYWLEWTEEYGEEKKRKELFYVFWRKALSIRFRYGLLRGKNIKHVFFSGLMMVLSYFFAKCIGAFWPKPQKPEHDTSNEAGRKMIFQRGILYWRQHLEKLGITIPGGIVLEIGSGNGQWLLAYAQDAQKVIGVEPMASDREFSQKKVSEYPELERKIEILNGIAENLPVEDVSVDVVLCSGVFMFTQQELAIKEIARVLKPGGKVCLTINGLGYFIMYVLNGLRYRSVQKMRYGLNGIFATWIKWAFGKQIYGWPKAVSHTEMAARLHAHGLELQDTRIWLDQSLYPCEHLGFATNYAFIAKKVSC